MLLSLLVLSAALASPAAGSDEKADAIAGEMLEALGGRENWDRARFFQFTFVRQGREIHIAWDRATGRYRLEATNESGVPYTVAMNLLTRQGKAWIEGRALADAELSQYLQRAERIWAGETYWLLMPYKLRDPGVVLRYEGEETLSGVVYDKLHLRFEGVGATPGDEYWAFVHRETRLMDRWRFKLESGFEGDYRWTGWQRFGGILLATERQGADGDLIRFENLVVAESVPEGFIE